MDLHMRSRDFNNRRRVPPTRSASTATDQDGLVIVAGIVIVLDHDPVLPLVTGDLVQRLMKRHKATQSRTTAATPTSVIIPAVTFHLHVIVATSPTAGAMDLSGTNSTDASSSLSPNDRTRVAREVQQGIDSVLAAPAAVTKMAAVHIHIHHASSPQCTINQPPSPRPSSTPLSPTPSTMSHRRVVQHALLHAVPAPHTIRDVAVVASRESAVLDDAIDAIGAWAATAESMQLPRHRFRPRMTVTVAHPASPGRQPPRGRKDNDGGPVDDVMARAAQLARLFDQAVASALIHLHTVEPILDLHSSTPRRASAPLEPLFPGDCTSSSPAVSANGGVANWQIWASLSTVPKPLPLTRWDSSLPHSKRGSSSSSLSSSSAPWSSSSSDSSASPSRSEIQFLRPASTQSHVNGSGNEDRYGEGGGEDTVLIARLPCRADIRVVTFSPLGQTTSTTQPQTARPQRPKLRLWIPDSPYHLPSVPNSKPSVTFAQNIKLQRPPRAETTAATDGHHSFSNLSGFQALLPSMPLARPCPPASSRPATQLPVNTVTYVPPIPIAIEYIPPTPTPTRPPRRRPVTLFPTPSPLSRPNGTPGGTPGSNLAMRGSSGRPRPQQHPASVWAQGTAPVVTELHPNRFTLTVPQSIFPTQPLEVRTSATKAEVTPTTIHPASRQMIASMSTRRQTHDGVPEPVREGSGTPFDDRNPSEWVQIAGDEDDDDDDAPSVYSVESRPVSRVPTLIATHRPRRKASASIHALTTITTAAQKIRQSSCVINHDDCTPEIGLAKPAPSSFSLSPSDWDSDSDSDSDFDSDVDCVDSKPPNCDSESTLLLAYKRKRPGVRSKSSSKSKVWSEVELAIVSQLLAMRRQATHRATAEFKSPVSATRSRTHSLTPTSCTPTVRCAI